METVHTNSLFIHIYQIFEHKSNSAHLKSFNSASSYGRCQRCPRCHRHCNRYLQGHRYRSNPPPPTPPTLLGSKNCKNSRHMNRSQRI
ncbi:Hypothetical predicted protein [Octopus vulgaris]|uniref:Uncharacterized protein n=1 Tax=Octopus vulgaris TaxID=6645 RepID=A0AA36AKN4_OCTVU|nr:Hypothetical predicted protein [Octopus vulgaris]